MEKALNEYRINAVDSLQGHYVLAKDMTEARSIAKKMFPNEKTRVVLWKTVGKGHSFANKLTPKAKKMMGRSYRGD